jgi:hypothetical protein
MPSISSAISPSSKVFDQSSLESPWNGLRPEIVLFARLPNIA